MSDKQTTEQNSNYNHLERMSLSIPWEEVSWSFQPSLSNTSIMEVHQLLGQKLVK